MATARISIRVPADKKEEFERIFYSIVYRSDPDKKIIYDVIKANPDKTLGQIEYLLSKTYGIRKSAANLMFFANRCGLPYAAQRSRSSTKPSDDNSIR